MEELYRQYVQIVYRFLVSACRNPGLAEDLTQETFLRAWESLERFDHSCRISTWLCQIAKHLLYQHWAKVGRIQLAELDESLKSGHDTEQTAIAKVELADVWDRLQTLSPDAKKTVELRVLGDLSFREIGELLGRSENWARVTFYRAKLLLIQDSQDAGQPHAPQKPDSRPGANRPI